MDTYTCTSQLCLINESLCLYCVVFSAPNNQNPFGEDEWDDDYPDTTGPVDDGSTGVPVKALYDYDGQEEDELTFKVGKYQQCGIKICFLVYRLGASWVIVDKLFPN